MKSGPERRDVVVKGVCNKGCASQSPAVPMGLRGKPGPYSL